MARRVCGRALVAVAALLPCTQPARAQAPRAAARQLPASGALQSSTSTAPLALASDDVQLMKAFTWATRQATTYAFEGDAVGPWFEAALPGRQAFCMRDVAHQAMGAHALGMQRHVRNMLRHFAAGISDARDWASLWEIDRHGQPAHADYRNDRDFWYNLPANFDVLDAAYRMFLWSDDPAYVTDPVFLNFYDRSVTDYVTRWSLGVDSVMTRARIMNRSLTRDPFAQFADTRGIPGYHEEGDHFVVGLDLLAAQYAGFAAYARIQEARGDFAATRLWLGRAEAVKTLVSTTWWDSSSQTFYDFLSTDHRLVHRAAGQWNSAPLYWPVAADGAQARGALQGLVRQLQASRSAPIEEQSHHPEVLYRHGESDLAYDQIMDLTRADRARREYPEVSFSVVGAVVTGLMGVSVDPVPPGGDSALLPYFANRHVMTLSQLTPKSGWVELRHLPVRANDVTIRHDGRSASEFTNHRGPALVWQAAFPGRVSDLLVDGTRVKAVQLTVPGWRVVSLTRVVVAPGMKVRVSVGR
ncbi:MAG: hypothetical protein IPF87_23790 [Gemmatimonadetes bacterium]|nr:hypothetical protein [Gemmatimonadota bacterium]